MFNIFNLMDMIPEERRQSSRRPTMRAHHPHYRMYEPVFVPHHQDDEAFYPDDQYYEPESSDSDVPVRTSRKHRRRSKPMVRTRVAPTEARKHAKVSKSHEPELSKENVLPELSSQHDENSEDEPAPMEDDVSSVHSSDADYSTTSGSVSSIMQDDIENLDDVPSPKSTSSSSSSNSTYSQDEIETVSKIRKFAQTVASIEIPHEITTQEYHRINGTLTSTLIGLDNLSVTENIRNLRRVVLRSANQKLDDLESSKRI